MVIIIKKNKKDCPTKFKSAGGYTYSFEELKKGDFYTPEKNKIYYKNSSDCNGKGYLTTYPNSLGYDNLDEIEVDPYI